jgi:predicted nucleic acid-binding Zn ribbon protein
VSLTVSPPIVISSSRTGRSFNQLVRKLTTDGNTCGASCTASVPRTISSPGLAPAGTSVPRAVSTDSTSSSKKASPELAGQLGEFGVVGFRTALNGKHQALNAFAH